MRGGARVVPPNAWDDLPVSREVRKQKKRAEKAQENGK